MSVENKLTENIVYIDFARAFDTVSHEKLQLKLQACGVSGQLLSLVMNFLHDRKQATKVGCNISHYNTYLLQVVSSRVAALVPSCS